MRLIDTHCHLYLEDFKSDIANIITTAKAAGVSKFYLPSIDNEVIEAMLALETAYPGECIAMMGLHPCSVKENYKKELHLAEQWLQKRKFVAIGEIGLDFYWDKSFIQQQYEAFEIQMQWALQYQLPIVIHTRNALQETIDLVKPFAAKGLKGIFHCFGGSVEEARQIMDMNFYLGIGGVVTYKKSGLAEVIQQIGLDRLVLETDAPYLTPVPFRGKRNESAYLKYIVEKIAEASNQTAEVVAKITTANAEKIFGY
jgi:TatD DNase family protein